MSKKLKVVSADSLIDISKKEINELIDEMIENSKNNMEEICELTLECTTLLASAENRAKALEEQSLFKRLIKTITGKNQKLQNAILQNNANALYAAQAVINRIMLECKKNTELLLAVNNRISDLYLELKEEQNDIAEAVMQARKAIVKFYEKYQKELSKQNERINNLEEYAKSSCPKCQKEMLSWKKICSNCGNIHPLKVNGISSETRKALSKISEVITEQKKSEDTIWDSTVDETVSKIEKVLRQIKMLANLGKIPGYTTELDTDIETLINECKNAEFQIAVVGVMKAGKSFLMNALIGAEIASVEVNPETAALTKFRSASGYYVKVRFHNEKQWRKLKESVEKCEQRNSLAERLNNSITRKMESEWVGHEEISIPCETLADLQNNVKKYTSAQTMEHLFVSEVEVGVDKSIFNMPKEVIFVDTPGLKDPVEYRANITKEYIKNADAVLIALKPGPFTVEGIEIITTVLDCTESDKAYIVGTQKDLNSEEERHKYVSNWVEHLVNAKRYSDKRKVWNRTILTSAKMELLIKKWYSLSEKEKEDESCFSNDDYKDLESYCGKIIKNREFSLMKVSQEEYKAVLDATGISILRNKLEASLIANYRQLKINDIEKKFIRCKEQIMEISQNAIKEQNRSIHSAIIGEEAIKKQICSMNIEKEKLKQANKELREAAQTLEGEIKEKIKDLKRKEY